MTKHAGAAPKLPTSSRAVFAKIKEIVNQGEIILPNERTYRGNGGPGRMLEHLCNVEANNMDAPDMGDWELKFHSGGALITLFHKEPQPRGAINRMVEDYGWDDDKGRISFRHTLRGESPRGFYVENKAERIVVRNNIKELTVVHWTHDTLMNAIGAKLRRLILVKGSVLNNPRRVCFESATAYWELNISSFCDAVEKGLVAIDFDARTTAGRGSAIRNHGTKFRVSPQNIGALYKHTKKII